MLMKILIFLAVVIGVFVVARLGAASAFRPASKADKVNKPQSKPVEDMKPCTVCGSYVVVGEACSCGQAPTP